VRGGFICDLLSGLLCICCRCVCCKDVHAMAASPAGRGTTTPRLRGINQPCHYRDTFRREYIKYGDTFKREIRGWIYTGNR
jgi:hypothetical protein